MNIIYRHSILTFIFALCFLVGHSAEAATLRVNPSTGVYTVGAPFTISVLLNTEGKAVNAADGTLTFNTRELSVISVSRASSIFNLWTEEPTFSNSAGTITFGGGSPSGYKGASGAIVTVTMKALGAGTPKITMKSGSALAADGMGTNVLTGMSGGTFTIATKEDSPAPEYIPPANTPGAPKVTSSTHGDESKWYREKVATLTWSVPGDVTSVRTALDQNAGTVPTKVYDEPISEKTLEDLPEGVSYFHIQFKNKDGWGRMTHYAFHVDSEAPKNFIIAEEGITDANNPTRTLVFNSEDVSPIHEYKIQIDGKDAFVYKDEKLEKKYALDALLPGYHTLTVEAFDSAGNTAIASYSLTVEAFEKPKFIEYPTRINEEVIPAIKGTTRPRSSVTVRIARAGDDDVVNADDGAHDPLTVTSDDNGEFIFIPNTPFDQGVYELTAVARDQYGNVSEESDPIKIIVDAPGYIVVGSMIVNTLSVVVPAVTLLIALIFGTWYLWHRLVRWKRKVRKETIEAEERLTLEFDSIVTNLNESIIALKESRKNKLTKAEEALIERIEADVRTAREKISKEIEDIERVIT